MTTVRGNIFCPDGQFRSGEIEIENGIIIAVRFFECDGPAIIPGLIDVHSHGCVGHDTCEASVDELLEMLKFQKSIGVTTWCPTTMTYGEEKLAAICERIAECSELLTEEHAHIGGIYLEGPFISKAKKGAQNEAYIMEPNIKMVERLIAASKGLVKLLAIAPEEAGAMELIKSMASKVRISVAHTTANYDITRAAFIAGAKQATHLFNAMPAYNHRDPGVVGAVFDSDVACAELICDGIHIHDAVIRNTFKVLGSSRVIMISDSMEATGMPDGTYQLGGQKVLKNGKRASLEDGTIAGSASTLMDCLKYAIGAGVPIAEAIFACTRNPAMALGIYDQVGSIEVGKRADLYVGEIF